MKRKANFSRYGDDEQEDRLSALSDDILICILSHVDTKLVVQYSILSKRWINLWTLLPVLNFDSSLFEKDQTYDPYDILYKSSLNSFIDKVLANRNLSVKIDSLNIKTTYLVASAFRYALELGVRSLSIDTSEKLGKYFLIFGVRSYDSLMSLSIKGMLDFGIFPKFSGLVSLRLELVKIVNSEPFSSFPNLEKLFLVNCKLDSHLNGLEVVAYRLTRLTISSYVPIHYKKLELLTPKLVLLELDGVIPISFEVFELPLLETIYIDSCYWFSGSLLSLHVEESSRNLIKILFCLKNAKCVNLSPSTVKHLYVARSMLLEKNCPFEYIKCLNLIPPPNTPLKECHYLFVAAYLVANNPQAIVKSLPRYVINYD